MKAASRIQLFDARTELRVRGQQDGATGWRGLAASDVCVVGESAWTNQPDDGPGQIIVGLQAEVVGANRLDLEVAFEIEGQEVLRRVSYSGSFSVWWTPTE